MKKFSIAILSALICALLMASAVMAAFNNGNFESGDYTGWSKATFINNLYPTRGSGGNDLSAIVGPYSTLSQIDPRTICSAPGCTDPALKYPPYGQYVSRVNSHMSYSGGGNPRNGNTISQLVTVAAGDVDTNDTLVHVRFVYSGVMVNPTDHSASEKPYIYVVVKNHTKGDDILYEFQSYAGEPGKGWVQGPAFGGGDYWQYLDWQFVDIAESGAHPVDVGDEIYVEVTAAGCEPSGHPGYAYVDQFSFNLPAPIISATDSPDPVDKNGILTYTFNYEAINAVNNPVINIPIPAQTTFDSVSDATHCAYAAGTVTCNMPSLGANASGDPFTMSVIVDPSASGTITLTNYTIQGDSTEVNTGTDVTTAIFINSAPVIAEGGTANVTMSEDSSPTPFALTLNATDPDGDTLTWSILTPAVYGTAGIDASTGVVSYSPFHNYNGSDSFVVQVSDGNGGTADITVNVTIEPVDDPLMVNQDYGIQYNTWKGVLDSNSLGGGYRHGTLGSFTFEPVEAFTQMKFITYRGPDQGKAQILVDGVIKSTVDLYGATPEWQYVVTVSGLTNTTHHVTVKASNTNTPPSTGTAVHVDGFQVGTIVYDDDMIGAIKPILFTYGSWQGIRTSSAHNAAYRLSESVNSFMKFSFDGVEFIWTTARGPAYGKAEIWVDGVLKQSVDLYNATQQWQHKVTIQGLTYGHHDVTIKVLGTKNASSTGTGVVSDVIEPE